MTVYINPRSPIHRFMTEGFLGQDEFRRPTNLCPYMRRFILLFLLTFIMSFVVLFVIQAALFFPIAFLFADPIALSDLGYIQTVYTLGILIDAIFIVMLVIWLIAKSGKKVAAAEAVTSSTFWQWGQAAHDKICPDITHERD